MTGFLPGRWAGTAIGLRSWAIQGDPDVAIHLTARSHHPGGVNTLFVDGHVAFSQDSIDLDIWKALATIDNPEDNEAGLELH